MSVNRFNTRHEFLWAQAVLVGRLVSEAVRSRFESIAFNFRCNSPIGTKLVCRHQKQHKQLHNTGHFRAIAPSVFPFTYDTWKPGLFLPWQVHREDAALARKIPHSDGAATVLDALAADRKPKAEPGSVSTSLLEQTKQMFDFPAREPAALVLNFDLYAIGCR